MSGGTDPLNPDSDGDGVLDGAEVITTTRVHDSGVTVALTGVGDLASRLHITELEDDPLVSGGPGRVSEAFDITLDPGARGALTSADITMPFDPTRVGGSETDLRLFTFDEELHAWVPAADDALQRIDTDANTVTATVEHFTVYAIFDIANWRSTWTALGGTCTPSGSGDVVFVDVAFTLDSSGSMSWNDPQGLRRSAAKSFVDALAPQDRGAVVDFDHWARLTQPLTSDKDALKAAIDRIDDWGGTNIGAGVSVGLNELARGDEPGRAQIMILLTDGEGSYSHTLTDRATAAGVTIYTIVSAGPSTPRCSAASPSAPAASTTPSPTPPTCPRSSAPSRKTTATTAATPTATGCPTAPRPKVCTTAPPARSSPPTRG